MRHCLSSTFAFVTALTAAGFAAAAAAPADSRSFDSRSAGFAGDSRSFKAEVLFRLRNPCPSTGETHGECKGYVIDRVIPVVCGGAEEPSNMQWQTLAQAREKDRWERIGCKPGRKLVLPTPAVPAEVFPMQEAPVAPDVQPLPRG